MDISKAASEMGKKGGIMTAKKHGKEHYQKLAAHMNKVRKNKKLKNTPTNPLT